MLTCGVSALLAALGGVFGDIGRIVVGKVISTGHEAGTALANGVLSNTHTLQSVPSTDSDCSGNGCSTGDCPGNDHLWEGIMIGILATVGIVILVDSRMRKLQS